MARFKTFSLAEFFTVVAALAAFSAVLHPITAAAKQGVTGTATTVSNLRLVGMAALAYSADHNDRVVQSQLGSVDTKNYWAVQLSPYVTSRAVFFDPTRPVPTGNTVTVSGIPMPWYQVTTFAINDGGYANHWNTLGGTCGGRRLAYSYGGRTLSGMMEPNKRVAFAPSFFNGTNVGWYAFNNYRSNWLDLAAAANVFSYNNMVWNTNALFANHLIPVVHADGSAGTLSRADFKSLVEAPTITQYCAWMSTEGQRTWGPYWSNN